MDLRGQVVLITGGSRGLGRAFAQALLADDARVAITARSAPELHETAAQLSSATDQVVAIPADATDPGATPKVVATAEERLGPITLLIDNAGQSRAVGTDQGGRSHRMVERSRSQSTRPPFCMPTPCSQVCSHAAGDGSSTWRVLPACKPYPRCPPIVGVRPPSFGSVKTWR